MSAHTLLEQLLRQGLGLLQGQAPGQDRRPVAPPTGGPGATGSPAWPGSPSAHPSAQPAGGPAQGQPARGTDWGSFGAGAATGAAATGALGLLLGHKQARRYAGKVAKYGGIAAIGLMAYQAYGRWQAQQAGTAGGAPAQHGGHGAPSSLPAGATQHTPGALPAPRTVDRLGPEEAEPHSRAMLVAMIAAAKADGHLDARERGLLDAELGRMAADHALRLWVDTELQRPLDPAEVARAASTPEVAAEMYLASLLVADEQSFMERAYLEELARQLKLAPGLKAELEAQAAAT